MRSLGEVIAELLRDLEAAPGKEAASGTVTPVDFRPSETQGFQDRLRQKARGHG